MKHLILIGVLIAGLGQGCTSLSTHKAHYTPCPPIDMEVIGQVYDRLEGSK